MALPSPITQREVSLGVDAGGAGWAVSAASLHGEAE